MVDNHEVAVQVRKRPERGVERRDCLGEHSLAILGARVDIVVHHKDHLASGCGLDDMVGGAAVEVEAVVDARTVFAWGSDHKVDIPKRDRACGDR